MKKMKNGPIEFNPSLIPFYRNFIIFWIALEIVGLGFAAQWVGFKTEYDSRFGEGILQIDGTPIYGPTELFVWGDIVFDPVDVLKTDTNTPIFRDPLSIAIFEGWLVFWMWFVTTSFGILIYTDLNRPKFKVKWTRRGQ